jgi:preprotein translocase subunit SecG
MGFIIGLLTAVLIFTCIILMLLVLIQLPKKEAGLGMAFGGGAADALFGAGAGNVLTKATKYTAGVFFVLAIGLGLLQGRYYRNSPKAFEKAVQKDAASAPATMPEAMALPTAKPTMPTPPPAATSAPASTVAKPVTVPAAATTTNK